MDKSADYETIRVAAFAAFSGHRLDEAEGLFLELRDRFPNRPAGLAGHARIAQARQQWAESVALHEQCLSAFPKAPAANDWLRSKARGLGQLGRWHEAASILEPMIAQAPDNLELAVLRAHILDRADQAAAAQQAWAAVLAIQPDHASATLRYLFHKARIVPAAEVLAEIRTGRFAGQDRFELLLQAVRLAMRCEDLPFMRDTLAALIPRAATIADCTALFPMIPAAFESGWGRTASWLALEQRLHALQVPQPERGKADLLAMRLRLALRDYPEFLRLFGASAHPAPDTWQTKLARHAEILRAPLDHDAPKVFGIGLSKTGTTSLNTALEQLGYLASHWTNDFTGELLTFEDAFLFDALTDTPTCMVFEALAHSFPNSRFIYTTRPLESWLDSYDRHSRRYFKHVDFQPLREWACTRGAARFGTSAAHHKVPLFWRHENPAEARTAFEARVAAFFTGENANRLLVLDASSGDGWHKLCAFLEKPVPDCPYPNKNIGQS